MTEQPKGNEPDYRQIRDDIIIENQLRCYSIIKFGEHHQIRCELDKGHKGKHNVEW